MAANISRSKALSLYRKLLRSARTWPGPPDEKKYILVSIFLPSFLPSSFSSLLFLFLRHSLTHAFSVSVSFLFRMRADLFSEEINSFLIKMLSRKRLVTFVTRAWYFVKRYVCFYSSHETIIGGKMDFFLSHLLIKALL